MMPMASSGAPSSAPTSTRCPSASVPALVRYTLSSLNDHECGREISDAAFMRYLLHVQHFSCLWALTKLALKLIKLRIRPGRNHFNRSLTRISHGPSQPQLIRKAHNELSEPNALDPPANQPPPDFVRPGHGESLRGGFCSVPPRGGLGPRLRGRGVDDAVTAFLDSFEDHVKKMAVRPAR